MIFVRWRIRHKIERRAHHRQNARIHGIGFCPCPTRLRKASRLYWVHLHERQDAAKAAFNGGVISPG